MPLSSSKFKPESVGPALGQVVLSDNGSEKILGQAWLAAPNKMITCGHVVDRYVSNSQALAVKFPASGNRYAVSSIRLHPSFVRQPDGLVKFDVAVLEVNLRTPESSAQPLPFTFEKGLRINQLISTVRFPVHLGQLSAALEPLSQEGHYLGLLRKHDSFHLLHDLPLSPGDSGAPLCSGNRVVAIHCGDTATLPGLNLPTTSIRLALWVDALRELDLTETRRYVGAGALRPLGTAVAAFFVALIVAFGAVGFMLKGAAQKAWQAESPSVVPVELSLNESLNGYKPGQDIIFTLAPRADCYFYLLNVDDEGTVDVLYPPYARSARLSAGELVSINNLALGVAGLSANPQRDEWHLVTMSAGDPDANALAERFLTESDWLKDSQARTRLLVKANDVLARLNDLKKASPGHVAHQKMDSPTAR